MLKFQCVFVAFDGYQAALAFTAEGQPLVLTSPRTSQSSESHSYPEEMVANLILVWNEPGCIMKPISRIIVRSLGQRGFVMEG